MKPVIFDMDGVVVDSEPLNDLHMAEYLPRIGVDTAARPLGQSFRGMNSRSLWTTLKREYELDEEVEALIRNARASYMDFLEGMPDIPIIPGADQLIEALTDTDHTLALASSANPKRIDLFLGRLDLAKYFEVVVSGDDVTHGKPHPETFLLAAARLGADPRECVVIEDATPGVRAAKAAGMMCLGYAGLTEYREDLSDADLIIADHLTVANFIRQGNTLREFIESSR